MPSTHQQSLEKSAQEVLSKLQDFTSCTAIFARKAFLLLNIDFQNNKKVLLVHNSWFEALLKWRILRKLSAVVE